MAKHQSRLDSLSSSKADPTVENRKRFFTFPDWFIPIFLLFGFLGILFLLFKDRVIPAIPVEIQPVISIRRTVGDSDSIRKNGKISDKPSELLFQASGWVEPDPYTILVPSLINGIVEEVAVLEGDIVKAGDILAKLVDDDAQIDLAEAKAQLEALRSEIVAERAQIPVIDSRRSGSSNTIASEQARLRELEDRLRRMKSVPLGSIAKVDLVSAQLQYDQQKVLVERSRTTVSGLDSERVMLEQELKAKQSTVREAELVVQRAELALARHTIRAPADGIIKILHVVPGRKRVIQTDDSHSAEIVEMYDPKKLQARVDVPLSEAARLSIGQSVELICDLIPDNVLKGVVTRIDGKADIQRNTLQVKVSIKNPDNRLRPEMLVRGRFFANPKASDSNHASVSSGARLSIYVPRQAIVNSDHVWVMASNRAEKRSVEIGDDIREDHQLVISGIRSGEQVILPPHTDLKPGRRVKINE